MTVPSYDSISTMFSRLNNVPKGKYLFLSTRLELFFLGNRIDYHLGRARLTRARDGRSPRAARDPIGDSPGRSREAAPSSRLVAFQRLSRRETPGPRLRGSQTPESLPCQRNSPCRPRSRTRREPTRRRRRKKTPRNARESPTRAWCVPLAVPRVTRDRARAPPAVPPRRSTPFP